MVKTALLSQLSRELYHYAKIKYSFIFLKTLMRANTV